MLKLKFVEQFVLLEYSRSHNVNVPNARTFSFYNID